MIELLNIDCVEYMRGCKNNQFDLAICDPPYGVGVGIFKPVGNRGEENRDDKKWDAETPSEEYFEQLVRVSKEQIIWGANYFNCFSEKGGAIVWDKLQPLPDSSQCEIASYSRVKKVYKYTQRWTNFVNTKGTEHPTEKPIELYKWLLHNFAKCSECGGSGEVASLTIDCDVQTCKKCKGNDFKVLDTHLGSGSIAIACHYEGIDLTACEIDKEYYDRAVKYINEKTMQTSLF